MWKVIRVGTTLFGLAGLRYLLPLGRHPTRRTVRSLAPGTAVLLLAGALLASCDSGADDLVGPAARTNLESATYLTENTLDGYAALEGGEFRAPVAPGSAAELVIRLGKWTLGDLDGQSELDAAAITIEEPGGSGTFFYLHALINDEGTLQDVGFAFLGDRIRIDRGRLRPRWRHHRRDARPQAGRAVRRVALGPRDPPVPSARRWPGRGEPQRRRVRV